MKNSDSGNDRQGITPAEATAPAETPEQSAPAKAAPKAAAKLAARPAPKRPRKRPALDIDMPDLPPIAGPARLRKRHLSITSMFGLVVALPSIIAAAYLWLVADDQYASTVAFSVRQEEMKSSMDLLGGITKLAGSTGSDTDILYEYIHSQDIVAQINEKLDLAKIWSEAWPGDPVFAYNPNGTIEDLTSHWNRKVSVAYDTGTGLMEVRVLAFHPEQAKLIAEEIYARSSALVNDLSDAARADAIRYSQEELDRTVARLKAARQELTAFRIKTQIVDPQADLRGQMGVLNTLQGQLAEALVEQDLLRETARTDDPRVSQIGRRITAIEDRIRQEREKFGQSGGVGGGGEGTDPDYATLVAEFERLSVDMRFAEETYRAALVSYDKARAEAQRQSRYLAAHIRPSLAQQSLFPQRLMLWALVTFFLTSAWAIGVLIYYSVRDRR